VTESRSPERVAGIPEDFKSKEKDLMCEN